jgi:hypothetical protein
MAESKLPDIDPETGWSRSIIQLMARAISTARNRNPKSWTVYANGDSVILHIGKRSACIMRPKDVELFVNVNAVDRMKLEYLGVTTKARKADDYPGTGWMTFPIEHALEVVEHIRKTHLDEIEAIAKNAANKNLRTRFRSDLLQKLNDIGDVSISGPPT